MAARVARFYGWTNQEINTISYEKLVKYLHSIEVLRAEETLCQMQTLDYVKHMKDQDRKKLHKQLQKTAKKYQDIKIKTQSVDDLEAMVKGLLSGR